MAFMVARTEKRKIGSLSGYQNHVDRKTDNHSNKDIDNSKTYLNYDLVGHENDKSFHKEFMDYINENRVGSRAVRKDAVVMQDWIIGSSQEFFDFLNPEETRKYFETAVEFFAEKFGRENIRFATVHMDEKTPHMHMGIVPMKDGKLTAKTIFDRNCLRMIQNELPQTFQKAGFDIQRGEPKSEKVHLQPEEYKATMRAAQEKAKEVTEKAEKNAQESQKELREQAYDFWEKDWDKTEKEVPDFKFNSNTEKVARITGCLELFKSGEMWNVTKKYPKIFSLSVEQVFDLMKEKYSQLKDYISSKLQNLSRRESEMEKRENTLTEKETSLESKLEGLNTEIETKQQSLNRMSKELNIEIGKIHATKALINAGAEIIGKLQESEPDIKINKPIFGEKTVTMPYAKYEKMRIANWQNPFRTAYIEFEKNSSGLVERMANREGILQNKNSDLRKENANLKKENTSLLRGESQYRSDYIALNNTVIELLNEDTITEKDLTKHADKLPQTFIDDYNIPVPEKTQQTHRNDLNKGMGFGMSR